MFCTRCGVELRDNDCFCFRCGHATANAPEPARALRLTRSMRDKSIAGVCSGFARYLGVDVVLVRVVCLATAILTGGLGAVAYLAAWIIMPSDYCYAPAPDASAASPASQPTR